MPDMLKCLIGKVNIQSLQREIIIFHGIRLVASQNIVTLEDEMRVTAQLSDILIESKVSNKIINFIIDIRIQLTDYSANVGFRFARSLFGG